jgi:hypothetical protein
VFRHRIASHEPEHAGLPALCCCTHTSLLCDAHPPAATLLTSRRPCVPQERDQREAHAQQERSRQSAPPDDGDESVPALTSRALGIAQRIAGYAGEDPTELRSNSSIDDLLPEVRGRAMPATSRTTLHHCTERHCIHVQFVQYASG